jgi:hypothetical protein
VPYFANLPMRVSETTAREVVFNRPPKLRWSLQMWKPKHRATSCFLKQTP